MAVRYQGNVDFEEIPGARGPLDDENGLSTIEVPYLCSEAEWANRPAIGAPYSRDNTLRLVSAVPTVSPGGLIDARLTYKGGQSNGAGLIFGEGWDGPRKSTNSTTKTMTAKGTVRWKSPTLTLKEGTFEAEFSIRYRARSMTYRCGATFFPTAPLFADLAEDDLPLAATVLSIQTSDPMALLLQQNAKILHRTAVYQADTTQVVYYYVWPDGTTSDTPIPVEFLATREEKTLYGVFDGYSLTGGFEFQRVPSYNSEQLEPSGISRVEESWEIEAITNVV